MAVVSAVATVVSSVVGFVGQRKAQKAAQRRAAAEAAERRRAAALQKRRDDIIAARQRRRSAAEARRLRGAAVNLAANRGAGGAVGAQGSTVPGVTGNITQQLNANNAFVNQVTSINSDIRNAFTSAAIIGSQPITTGSTLTAFGGFLGKVGGFAASPSGAKLGSFFGGPAPSGGNQAGSNTAVT